MTYRLQAAISNWTDRLAAPLLRRTQQAGVVVLTLHSVRKRPEFKIDVTPEQLDRLLGIVRSTGAEIVSLAEATSLLRSKKPPGAVVALTFDDGYRDFLEEAVPVLRRHRAPATVSIVTAHVDSKSPFEFDSGRGRLSMSWSDLRALQRDLGELVTIANHSHAHRDFSTLSLPEIERDIRVSQERIAAELGSEASVFTYPKGTRNRSAESFLLRRFETLLSGTWGVNTEPDQARCLDRIPVFFFDSVQTLALKARGVRTGYYWGAALTRGIRGA